MLEIRGQRDTAPKVAIAMFALGWLACGEADSTQLSGGGSGPSSLHVDLQAGFRGETVEVHIDGDLVYSSQGVTTALLTDFADSFEVELAGDESEVLLELAVGPATYERRLDVDRGAFVGLSIVDGGLEVIQRKDAFGYG